MTSTGYTVPALGDLTAGLLIHAKGFPTAANNGLKVVASSSTGTEIKASGLTAESLTAARGATVEVAGVQGDTADITLNSSGNLTSTTLDFTTLGLNIGQTIGPALFEVTVEADLAEPALRVTPRWLVART